MFASLPNLGLYLLVVPALFLLYSFYIMLLIGRQNAATRLFQRKQYAEAAASYRSLLKWRLPSGIEADTRRRLSDALDSAGRGDEAAAERERAEAVSARSPGDAQAQSARGDLLERKRQYDDACEAYGQALRQTPVIVTADRATIMAKLSAAHYHAGRPVEAVKWAEDSLSSRPKRGHLVEAVAAARRAVGTCDSPFRSGRIAEVESLRELGRFEEARAVVARMKQGPRHPQPPIERRLQAMCALTLAWVESADDRPDAALAALEETRDHLKVLTRSTVWPPPPSSNEDKLVVFCDATAMRVCAALGQRERAQSLRADVESYLPRYANDRATLMGIYANFARTAFYLGDLAESRAFWQRHLDCKPSPIGLPYAHYWLGEVALHAGETDTAREEYRQAASFGIDSLDARRAQARLDELGG